MKQSSTTTVDLKSTNAVAAVSVVIPVKSGEFPARAIECLKKANFEGTIEILIVHGSMPSLQRNEAVKRCAHEIVYFLDDDSFVAEDAISQGVKILSDKRIAVVGGPAVTHGDASWLERCVGDVFASPFGGSRTRHRSTPIGRTRLVEGEELVLCNLMTRKSVFQELSGLRDTLFPGEDPEFFKRLRRRGDLMCYHPDMIVHRTRRKSLQSFARQCLSYGAGRGRHVCEGMSWPDLAFFIPTLFVLYLAVLAMAPSPIMFLPLAIYLALDAVSSISIGVRRRSFLAALGVAPLFLIMHLAYGTGMVRGLLFRVMNRPKQLSSISFNVFPLVLNNPARFGSSTS